MSRGSSLEIFIYDGDKYRETELDITKTCNGMSIFIVKLNNDWHISYQYFFSEYY